MLIAVDASEHSDKIAEEGCKLAKLLSANTLLLYVSKLPDIAEEYLEFGGSSPTSLKAEKQVKIAETVTSKLAESVRASGVQCEVVLESGDPAQKILVVASERNVSMIIIGLRGLHGIGKIRSLGSVSRRVIENARCPVLVV